MTKVYFLLLLFAIFGLAHADDDDGYLDEHSIRAADAPKDAPTFARYPAPARYKGPLAAPDVKHHARSRQFRTMIREGAKRGPNFAGHYTLTFWGCGSGCISVAIVDARSGKVFHPSNLRDIDNSNVAYEELVALHGDLINFRIDSKLLIIIGGINEDPALRGISYFLWENERLRRIRFAHKPEG